MIPSYIVPKYNHLIKKLFACRLKKWNNWQITSFISCHNIFASTCSTQISVSQISVPDPFPAQATQIPVITFFHFLSQHFLLQVLKHKNWSQISVPVPLPHQVSQGGVGATKGREDSLQSPWSLLLHTQISVPVPFTNFCAQVSVPVPFPGGATPSFSGGGGGQPRGGMTLLGFVSHYSGEIAFFPFLDTFQTCL